MTEVIGVDHIYVAVSDLERSEVFYDRVLLEALSFRKNKFTLDGDPHIQYFNRHFGYVLRPSRIQASHDSYSPGLHHLCLRVDSADGVAAVAAQLRSSGIEASEAMLYPESPLTIGQRTSPTPMAYALRSQTTGWNAESAMTAGK
jgi:glyoxylase I family protein